MPLYFKENFFLSSKISVGNFSLLNFFLNLFSFRFSAQAVNLTQSVETLPALPDSEDENSVEVDPDPEERVVLIRSQSDRGPASVREPSPLIRTVSLPETTAQVDALEERARTLQSNSQAAPEVEAQTRSPPRLRRSARISLPTKRFSPY